MTQKIVTKKTNDQISAMQTKIEKNLEDAKKFLNQNYILNLSKTQGKAIEPIPLKKEKVRIFHFDRIVYNGQDTHSRLLSVYGSLLGITDTCFMIIHGSKTSTDLYLGVRVEDTAASICSSALEAGIKGNFPGTEIHQLSSLETVELLNSISEKGKYNNKTVISVAQIPSFRKSMEDNNNTVKEQGMEHFIDAMRGQEYTAMIIADSIKKEEILNYKTNLENLFSSLSSLKTITIQYGTNDSISEQKAVTDSITQNITESIANGYSYTSSHNHGVSFGKSPSIHTQYKSIGLGYGTQNSSFNSDSVSSGTSNTHTTGTTSGTGNSITNTNGVAHGTTQSLSMTQTNKAVEEMLDRIEQQIKRYEESNAFGLWNCAAYFASPNPDIALVAANNYKAIICGEKSSKEPSYVNYWNCSENSDTPIVLKSLASARSPLFKISQLNNWLSTAGTMVTGNELPILMGLPGRSVLGLTVVDMASFGREVHVIDKNISSNEKTISIGNVRHMGKEENVSVDLAIEHFTKHVLICGTTGVGKSTLSTMLLRELSDNNIHFTVVEPVKGEYADLLADLKDLTVYTTNPRKERMLHINPFIFNKDKIPVLSHIDRLIEVFSVCWPLYAAQPALLRESIEKAYIMCGWDLSNSVFAGDGPVRYPTFHDVLQVIPEVIKQSKYVGESKGTYEGALLTRVSMLTHGTYGQIFNGSGSLPDRSLFERFVVIDLSELGSTETISLIMGLLIIRLREYRISSGKADNHPLRHVLVLEEAHNLLKKDNSHNDEGGESVTEKSVEMISRIIGEMRGYGQGVMILDQAPDELHLSAMRNTATKIIMRIPETKDQDAISNALSLNDNQAKELSRLPERVALIYQTGWVEPVMAKIRNIAAFQKKRNNNEITYEQLCTVRGQLIHILNHMYLNNEFSYCDIERTMIDCENLYDEKKKDIMTMFYAYKTEYEFYDRKFETNRSKDDFFYRLYIELLSADNFFSIIALPKPGSEVSQPYFKSPEYYQQCSAWRRKAIKKLEKYVIGIDENEGDIILRILLSADANEDDKRYIKDVRKTLYNKKEK